MESLLQHTRDLIATHGWSIQHVGAVSKEEFSFAYTVGLTALDHPELILSTPLPPPGAAHLLNELGGRVRQGKVLAAGQEPDKLIRGDSPPVLVRAESDELNFASALYPDSPVRALQLVLPDRRGLYPWEKGYDHKGFPQKCFGGAWSAVAPT